MILSSTKIVEDYHIRIIPYGICKYILHGLILCLCVRAQFCVLADSTAAEERFTAESTGCLLQGAASTTGEEGKRMHNLFQHCMTF